MEKLTEDHIPPAAWYADSTPPELEKWTIPACDDCNCEYGRLERSLFQQLALGIDPSALGAEGIGERARRAFDPVAAKDDRDRKHREASREKLRRRLRMGDYVAL